MVPVTNTGEREGTEVVQLYVRRDADTEGPLKSLRGFQRVSLAPGQTAEVSFPLTDEVFLSWNEEKQDMVPAKGDWTLFYGGSSTELKSLTLKR